VPELCPLCFALCFLSQPNMLLFSVLYHTKGCMCTAHFVAQIELIVFLASSFAAHREWQWRHGTALELPC